MPLDPQVADLLSRLAAAGLPAPSSLSPTDNRELYARVVAARRGPGWAPEPVGSSQDLLAGGVPARLHRPEGVVRPPVLAFFHGGGWVVGDLDTHDGITRALCRRAGTAVLAVDYRLAPEHPYPAALQDCLAATRWLAQAADGLGLGAVAVGGDSAGGALAACVALACREAGPALAAQLLVYPCTDAGTAADSYWRNAEGYGLTAETMRWYWSQYAQDADRDDPLLSPARAADLSGLPPAVVVTAEYDPLVDEGDALARRLAAAGVPVRHRQLPGQVHGFLGMTGAVAAADEAVTVLAHDLRDLLR